jgi:hypothetical protein
VDLGINAETIDIDDRRTGLVRACCLFNSLEETLA